VADNQDNGNSAADPSTGNGNGNGNGNGEAPPPAPRPGSEPQREVLSLAQLIGAPIHALVDAEAQSAMATARFIRDVGFRPPEDAEFGELGDLQMAHFKSTRAGADGVEEEFEVQVPLLTMLPIPALQIRDAELQYVVKVVQTETLPASREKLTRNLGESLEVDAPATMRATFGREPRSGDRRSMDMLLKMKVRIEQADMPAGLARLLNLAGESVSRNRLEGPPPEEDD
jgi:hypothetical protein